jgi:hypothetical protein
MVTALIAAQKLRIAKLERQIYGQRSERSARLIEQLSLAFEELEASATEDELAAEAAEIFEERYGRRSTVITSQLPIDRWHEIMGDPTNPPTPTPSWTVSSTTLIASNSPAKACVGPKQSNRGRLDPTPRPVTTIPRAARPATWAASLRNPGGHYPALPGRLRRNRQLFRNLRPS